jgi:hypothetical protein
VAKPAIVKFTVDLLAPGAIITPTLVHWYDRCVNPHSLRCLYPVKPRGMYDLCDVRPDGAQALTDFMHVRATTIMDEWDGVTDGELDRLLTRRSLDDVFDMQRIRSAALILSPPYALNKTQAAWLEIHEVDGEQVKFVWGGQTSVRELAQRIKEAPI